jgi:hypothetical protein
MRRNFLVSVCLVAILSLVTIFFSTAVFSAASGTTSVKVTKLANDGVTILNQRTVTYQWLQSNLPVLGDGTTHYYHQGPVFVDDPNPAAQETLRWNQAEDQNIVDKDMGALKGTNLTSLCDLAGGMSSGDTLRVKSRDGWNRTFAYKNVYQYSSREGPMVLTWYRDGVYPDSGYTEGMRVIWFADTSTNPWGYHVFGNWDWRQSADSQYWYYYQQSGQKYPTTTGLSGQVVSELIINSNVSAGSSTSATAPFWDLNADHVCNIGDLVILGQHWGQTGTAGWIGEDFNNDGVINVGDIVKIGTYWGQSW